MVVICWKAAICVLVVCSLLFFILQFQSSLLFCSNCLFDGCCHSFITFCKYYSFGLCFLLKKICYVVIDSIHGFAKIVSFKMSICFSSFVYFFVTHVFVCEWLWTCLCFICADGCVMELIVCFKISNLPMCIFSMWVINSPNESNFIPHPLNLHMLIRNTAISHTTDNQNGVCENLFFPLIFEY